MEIVPGEEGVRNKRLGWWSCWKIFVSLFPLFYRTISKNGREEYHSPSLNKTNLTGTQSIFYIGTSLLKHTSLKKPLWLPTTEKVGCAMACKARLSLALLTLWLLPHYSPCLPPCTIRPPAFSLPATSASGPLHLQFPLSGQSFPQILTWPLSPHLRLRYNAPQRGLRWPPHLRCHPSSWHTHTLMHTHFVHSPICSRTFTHTDTHAQAPPHTLTHIHTCILTHLPTFRQSHLYPLLHTHTHSCTHKHAHSYLHTLILRHSQAHAYIYTVLTLFLALLFLTMLPADI